MLANKRLIRVVVAVLVLAVAYDVWHLTSKSRGAARASASADHQTQNNRSVAAASSSDATSIVDAIQAQLASIDRHRRCNPVPPPARNPFLLQVEQDSGLPLTEIKERERRQAELERRAKSTAKDEHPVTIDLSRYRLSAVLVRGPQSLAIINDQVLGVGETLRGTQIEVKAIDADGVTLSRGSLAGDAESVVLGFSTASSTTHTSASSLSPPAASGKHP